MRFELEQFRTLEQVREFITAVPTAGLERMCRASAYRPVTTLRARFSYCKAYRPEKGLLRRSLALVTGCRCRR